MNATYHLIENLLESMDLEESIEHSIKNHHVKGLHYVNLLRSDRLTCKLYYIDPKEFELNPYGYLVWPHDHAYNFSTTVIAGEVRNITFTINKNEKNGAWTRNGYKRGEGLIYIGRVDLNDFDSTKIYTPGMHYYMNGEGYHTIVPGTKTPTVLFLQQYHKVQPLGTSMVVLEDDIDPIFSPECNGKFHPQEFSDLLREIKFVVRMQKSFFYDSEVKSNG